MTKKTLIIGQGVSGKSAQVFLHHYHSPHKLYDDHKSESKPAKLDFLENTDTYKQVIVSPGVNFKHELLEHARKHNLKIQTEVDLGLDAFRGELVGITGTNGKSTVTAMLQHCMQASQYQTLMAGNIGRGVCETLLDAPSQPDYLILELSSYQLHYMQPHLFTVGVFTNFAADHEAWHGSRESYFRAKWKLAAQIKKGGVFITTTAVLAVAKKLGLQPSDDYQTLVLDSDDNPSFVSAVMQKLTQQDETKTQTQLNSFRGLPHRLEYVCDLYNHPVWNDSKATNFESTLYALQLKAQRPTVLLLGGELKSLEVAFLKRTGAVYTSHIDKIFTFGPSAKKLEQLLKDQYVVKTYVNLKTCLDQLSAELLAHPAQVLFSPGGASFDEFKNFAERGDFFRDKMRQISEEVSHDTSSKTHT